MRITKLVAKNYRSLEDVEIEFNPYYNALSGKNNSGKSNIIKAINSFQIIPLDPLITIMTFHIGKKIKSK